MMATRLEDHPCQMFTAGKGFRADGGDRMAVQLGRDGQSGGSAHVPGQASVSVGVRTV